MKFALVVGHETISPGAKGLTPLDCYEYDYNKELAAMISCDLKDLGIESEIFFRDKVGIHGVYREVNTYFPSGVIELHFNASGIFTAKGTETLYVPRVAQSKILAQCVHEKIIYALSRTGEEDRGLHIVDPIERGYTNLILAQCPSILIEPFFGDNLEDASLGFHFKGSLALAVSLGVQKFIGGLT